MASPLRTAVLGYGLAGRVFHCPFVSAIPGLELTAIVQRHGDEAARAYPNARILRSPEEAFADRSLDLIVVGTPNEAHFEHAAAALRAGKHVVVDKPVCTSSADIRTLIDLANTAGKLLFPFHNRRWDADFLTLRKLLVEGTLGHVVQVISRFDRYRPVPKPNTWKEAPGPHTGILFDLGPHLVDQALCLFGVPDTLTATSRRDRDRTDIDDAFSLRLEYHAQRLRYECHATMIAAEPSPRFLVHGVQGSFQKFGLDPQEPAMVSGAARPPRQDAPDATTWLAEPEAAWGTLTLAEQISEPNRLTRQTYPSLPGDYRLFYAGVRDAVLGLAPAPVSAEDAFRTVRLLELTRESSQTGRTLPVVF